MTRYVFKMPDLGEGTVEAEVVAWHIQVGDMVSATLGVVSWLLAYVHGCIHTPRNRLIEHMRWYQWLDRHHYIHHIDQRANINFLLPICDVLFGTLKRRVTESEARRFPSFEEAKPMAKDIGRRAVSAG